MLKDLLFAFRQIRRSPGFTAIAVLTLGIGIGANTAIFSLIDTIFLHGLSFERADELVQMQGNAPERNLFGLNLSITKFQHFRDHQTTMTGVAADFFNALTLTGMGDPVQLNGIQMSSNYFDVLGVKPVIGRLFRPEEDSTGEHVALLSAECWASRFSSDRNILGRTLTLNGVPHTIVGVVPSQPVAYFGLVDVFTTRPEEFPGITPELKSRGFSFLRVIGRRKPGVTEAQVQENATALMATYKAANGEKADATWLAGVVNLEQNTFGTQLKSTLWMLLGAVGLVLLIATSNVANLLLVRFSGRRREISTRLSLGAERSRVVRLFLFESLLVSLLAAAAGIGVGRLGIALLLQLNTPLPIGQHVPLSPLVLGFTIAIALATGLLMGLYPSVQAARTNVVDALKEGGRGNTLSRGQHWFRMIMLGAQVTLSCVLLICAFLLVTTVVKLQRQEPGFSPSGLLVAGLTLPAPRYPTKAEQAVFANQFLDELRHAPGIRDAAIAIGLPLAGFGIAGPYSRVDGQVIEYPKRPLVPMRFVSANYFSTLGIALREGRQFDQNDRTGSPVVCILNESGARTIFPEGGALGRHLFVGSVNRGEDAEIIGIAADVRSNSLQQVTPIEIYRPRPQRPGNAGVWQLAVKTATADPTPSTSTVVATLRRLDPNLPLVRPTTMATILDGAIGPQRLMMTLLGIFAAFALILAVVGIYSVVAYMVSQRKNEIGVRLALGARPGDVIRMVLRQGMVPVMAGLVVGVGAALGLGKLLNNLLNTASWFDVTGTVITVAALLCAGVVACWLPSWRATKAGLAEALRV